MTDYQNAVDEAYRAIGRYMTEFSQLVWTMRHNMATQISPAFGGNFLVSELVLGEMGAAQVAASFFALARKIGDLDDDEMRIAKALQNQVDAMVTQRNDIAHGDWFIGWGQTEAKLPEPPRLIRTKPKRADPTSIRNYEPDEIDRMAEEVERVRKVVMEFAVMTLSSFRDVRVRNNLVLDNGVVKRTPGRREP